eukprot:150964-Amphidinium_carterae.2
MRASAAWNAHGSRPDATHINIVQAILRVLHYLVVSPLFVSHDSCARVASTFQHAPLLRKTCRKERKVLRSPFLRRVGEWRQNLGNQPTHGIEVVPIWRGIHKMSGKT